MCWHFTVSCSYVKHSHPRSGTSSDGFDSKRQGECAGVGKRSGKAAHVDEHVNTTFVGKTAKHAEAVEAFSTVEVATAIFALVTSLRLNTARNFGDA